jgi:hypothetical protein
MEAFPLGDGAELGIVRRNEVKRNCMRATECGKEAWSEAASR